MNFACMHSDNSCGLQNKSVSAGKEGCAIMRLQIWVHAKSTGGGTCSKAIAEGAKCRVCKLVTRRLHTGAGASAVTASHATEYTVTTAVLAITGSPMIPSLPNTRGDSAYLRATSCLTSTTNVLSTLPCLSTVQHRLHICCAAE